MPKNIEIKARIENYQSTIDRAKMLTDQRPTVINQDDTFFNCPNGKLKLRKFSNAAGELIFYQRASEKGPKESFYTISPTHTPQTLHESLALAYGVFGRVR